MRPPKSDGLQDLREASISGLVLSVIEEPIRHIVDTFRFTQGVKMLVDESQDCTVLDKQFEEFLDEQISELPIYLRRIRLPESTVTHIVRFSRVTIDEFIERQDPGLGDGDL